MRCRAVGDPISYCGTRIERAHAYVRGARGLLRSARARDRRADFLEQLAVAFACSIIAVNKSNLAEAHGHPDDHQDAGNEPPRTWKARPRSNAAAISVGDLFA
jgi:hypothetical protein